MDGLEKPKGKGSFAIKEWEKIRQGGGAAPSPTEIEKYLQGRTTGATLSREEVIQRISHYFNNLIAKREDEETGEIKHVWTAAPTKSGLARSLGITAETLSRYLGGKYGNGIPYRIGQASKREVVRAEDFDLIQAASNLIEEFHESRLSTTVPVGSIFYLKCSSDVRWRDTQNINLTAQASQIDMPELSREEIAARYRAQEEFREKPQLPEGID